MRIVVHFNDLTGKIKGSDRSRFEIAKRLARNHEVIGLANNVGSETYPFQVIRMPKPKNLAFYHYYQAELALHPDAVITKTFFGDAPCIAIAHNGSVQKMFAEDSKWKKNEDWRLSKKVVELTMTYATALVTRTEDMAREIKEIYGIDSYVIPNGVDTEFFRPLNIAKDPKRVLMAGTLSPRKGIETLAKVIRITPELEWRICGDGPLKVLLNELPNVRTLGWLSPEKLLLEYNKAAVFVLPSRYDPFPLVVLEAMSCNLPVVISDEVTVGPLLDEQVGFRVPVDDAEAFADKLREALAGDYGDRPRNRALDYDWEVISGKYEGLLLEIIGSSNR